MSIRDTIPAPVRRALRPVRSLLATRKRRPVSLPGSVGEWTSDHAADCIQNVASPTERVAIVGYLRERSTRHVAGFIKNGLDRSQRVPFEVVCLLPGSERTLATGTADIYDRVLALSRSNDPIHGFRVNFEQPVTERERDYIEVRPLQTGEAIPHAPDLLSAWKPIRYIAMDIVDNCNLRCPFCLFDHAPVHKTNVMSDETFSSALRLLPYVGPDGHWMSCLHEPSIHPKLTEFIQRIPREYRHVMHYTTNLAKRMPDVYFDTLATSGLNNLNVSIESRDPAIYERMRNGARFRIFMENWDKLLAAFSRGSAPPPLRYIAMAYKSNYRELPELVEWLRTERKAWKIEIRDTYDVAHIPQEFKTAEYLERHEWLCLKDALAEYPPHEVSLVLPANLQDHTAEKQETPADPLQAAMEADLPGMIQARILHDGTMFVYSCPAADYPVQSKTLATLNVREVEDPESFIRSFTG